MKLNMSELDTKETKPKMSEYNEKKYIILNEFSEKNIDDLYCYCGGSFTPFYISNADFI